MKTKCWRIECQADDQNAPAHIQVYDLIGKDWLGEGVSAKDFVADLAAVAGRDLTLHINSAGGDVFEGFAMLTALDQHKGKKTVCIESLAASMASVLAMCADKGCLQIAENGYLMIHNPRGMAYGEAKDLRARADLMDSLRANMLAVYRRHTDLTEEQLGAAMDAETWYDAKAAEAAGFADTILAPAQVAACLDGGALEGAKVPEAVKALFAPAPQDAAAAVQAAAEAKAAAEMAIENAAKAKAEAEAGAAAVSAKLAALEEEHRKAIAAEREKVAAAEASGNEQLARIREDLKAARAKVAALSGGMEAPGASGAPRSFAAAVDAVRKDQPKWTHQQCWCEAKNRFPELWERAKAG